MIECYSILSAWTARRIFLIIRPLRQVQKNPIEEGHDTKWYLLEKKSKVTLCGC